MKPSSKPCFSHSILIFELFSSFSLLGSFDVVSEIRTDKAIICNHKHSAAIITAITKTMLLRQCFYASTVNGSKVTALSVLKECFLTHFNTHYTDTI